MKAACFGVRDHRMVISRRQATARTADKLAILRRHPLFGQLSQAAMEHLGSYMKRRSLLRGTVIFAKGDPCTGLMGVLAGAVKISVPSADGRDLVLSIMHEGDILGEIALLDGHSHIADATAMTDCELMVIEPRNFIIPFLRSQPDLSIQIIEILCSRVRRTTEQVEDVTLLNLPTQLAKTLFRLTADAEPPGSTPKIAITQREIGQIIGRSRESTNKQLRSWAKHGLVRLERGAVMVLHRDKLAEVAAQGFGSIPRELLRRLPTKATLAV
jgi:CRP/FNR family transcriptional regulator, cyclic AMP receptor protein